MTQKQIEALPEQIKLSGEYESRSVMIDEEFLNPHYSQQIYNHSPDGFNWGYGGSGPAQLALAILMIYLPIEEAVQFHQQFKWDVIAGLPQTDFEVEINLKEKISQYSKEEKV